MSEPQYPDVLEYDEEHRCLIATNRLGPDEYGASAIVAFDLGPLWGHRLVQLARRAALTNAPRHEPESRGDGEDGWVECSCGHMPKPRESFYDHIRADQ